MLPVPTVPAAVRVDRFDSWGAFVEYSKGPSGSDQRDSRTHTKSFAGTNTWEEALNLALNGWPDGERESKAISGGIFDYVSNMIERPVYVYDYEGTDIDVARFLDGEPECWQRQETRITEGPGRRIVRLVMNAAVSAGIDASIIEARGSAVVALVELLDLAGHGCEIILAGGINGGGGAHAEFYVTVKSADQPLDLARVAFALAHPACLRRLGFSLMERYTNKERRMFHVPGNYGYPGTIAERGDLFIEHGMVGEPQWSTPTAARAWVIEQLKKQGVTLNESAA